MEVPASFILPAAWHALRMWLLLCVSLKNYKRECAHRVHESRRVCASASFIFFRIFHHLILCGSASISSAAAICNAPSARLPLVSPTKLLKLLMEFRCSYIAHMHFHNSIFTTAIRCLRICHSIQFFHRKNGAALLFRSRRYLMHARACVCACVRACFCLCVRNTIKFAIKIHFSILFNVQQLERV